MTTLFRPRGWVWRGLFRVTTHVVVDATVLGAIVIFGALAVGPRFGHYQTVSMLTGSMRPQFPPGSVVILTPQRPQDIEVGQVLTFEAPTEDRRIVTHRVAEVVRREPTVVIRTKGDANTDLDPWVAEVTDDVVWRARGDVPGLGRAIAELREPWVRRSMLYALPGLLVAWLLLGIWRPAVRRPETG